MNEQNTGAPKMEGRYFRSAGILRSRSIYSLSTKTLLRAKAINAIAHIKSIRGNKLPAEIDVLFHFKMLNCTGKKNMIARVTKAMRLKYTA